MNPHHDIMDDIALLALGVLPENEASTIAAHLEDCETCRQAYTEFRTSANLIGYAGEPVSATLDEVAAARLKARVMNAVRPSSHSNGEAVVSPAQALARPRSAWFPYAVAAAALVFATVVASDDAGLRKRAASENEQIDALQAHAAVQDEVLAHSDTRTRDI